MKLQGQSNVTAIASFISLFFTITGMYAIFQSSACFIVIIANVKEISSFQNSNKKKNFFLSINETAGDKSIYMCVESEEKKHAVVH